jgi:hypothetical protein
MHTCKSHGHKEKCLLKDKYPVTKNGRPSKSRIRSAAAYGAKFGVLPALKKAGLCSTAKREKISLKACSS